MTKKFHKCEKCKGTEGIYVKICPETGEVIETYEMQYERIAKMLKDSRNYVEPDGSKV
jgi:hypothetical protein